MAVTTSIMTAFERDSLMRVHKNKEDYKNICQSNQVLFTDFLLYLSISDYTYGSATAMKSSVYLFLVWNSENNNNVTFFSLKKIHFHRFFRHLIEEKGYSYDRVRIIKSHLSTLSDFAECVLGLHEIIPTAKGDYHNKWFRFKNIVKDVDLGEAPYKVRVCNKHTFAKEDLERLEWFLNETKNYEAIVVLHFCVLGLDLLDLKRQTLETYDNKLCNKWLRVLDKFNLPFDNVFVVRCEGRIWRLGTKEDIERYEDLFSTFLGRKFIIC